MNDKLNKKTNLNPAPERPVRYVDFDIFESLRLRISLRLLLVLAGTLIGLTTTTVITYNNLNSKINSIEQKVEEIGTQFETLKEKNGEALHNLEKNDINLKNEIESLKRDKKPGDKN